METTTAIQAIEVGTYVRSKTAMSDMQYSGKIGQVADTASDGRLWVKYLNQCYDSQVREFLFQPLEVEPLEDQENAPRLRELEAWESRYHFMNKRVSDYQNGIDMLSRAAIEVAEKNNYCSEYDSVVDEVNRILASNGHGLVSLAPREREYEVEVEITSTIVATTTVTVTATSEEAASELVEEYVDDYTDPVELLVGEIRNNTPDWDVEVRSL